MRGSLPLESLADGSTASVVPPQLLSTSLCPWDRPCLHWIWWGGDSNGHNLFGSSFSYWKAWRQIMSAELPLSMRILLVLNPSIFNIMTNGSLWGCFTPMASASLKDIFWSVCLCLNGSIMWTLFTCLWYAFLRDLNDPPVKGPPAIVFISPITSCGGWCGRSSLLEVDSC